MGTRVARYFASGRTIDEGTSGRVVALEAAEDMARNRAEFYGVGQVWLLHGGSAAPVATFERETPLFQGRCAKRP